MGAGQLIHSFKALTSSNASHVTFASSSGNTQLESRLQRHHTILLCNFVCFRELVGDFEGVQSPWLSSFGSRHALNNGHHIRTDQAKDIPGKPLIGCCRCFTPTGYRCGRMQTQSPIANNGGFPYHGIKLRIKTLLILSDSSVTTPSLLSLIIFGEEAVALGVATITVHHSPHHKHHLRYLCHHCGYQQ